MTNFSDRDACHFIRWTWYFYPETRFKNHSAEEIVRSKLKDFYELLSKIKVRKGHEHFVENYKNLIDIKLNGIWRTIDEN